MYGKTMDKNPRRAEESCGSFSPYLSDVGILTPVPCEWEAPWLSRHQILTRLAKYFHIVWCTPAQWWREVFRDAQQRKVRIDNTDVPGLTIYHPENWLPAVGRPRFLAVWTERQRLRRARSLLLNRGCQKIVLYLWRPDSAAALDLIEHDLSCYYINDEYTFSAIEQPIDPSEAQLISSVDQVFIHSPALLEKKGNLNPQTTFIPNGVDYDAFATPYGEPADLQCIPRPRIGYVGRIKEQLDLALLTDLARRHQEWSFVFVGPHDGIGNRGRELQQLSELSNVYLLGGKSVTLLPAYTQHLDVCMLPYELNGYTKFIYPLKLHEYLASGRPVVGSPIRSLQDFAHVIKLARTSDEWSLAVQNALSPTAHSAEQIEARRRVARQHDWDGLVARIAQNLCSGLGSAYVERFAERCQTIPDEYTGIGATHA
jgi:glycosyltransferase involved in cell wall biosynthesis